MLENSLGLRFPTDATSTSRTNSLGIIHNTERAADELGGEIDRRTTQESERDCVYDDTSLRHGRVLEFTWVVSQFRGTKKTAEMDHNVLVLKSALLCKLHFILISMAAARLDGDSQGGT
jgi:hypothetical protein